MARFTASIDDNLKARLDTYAKDHGYNRSEALEVMIRAFFEQKADAPQPAPTPPPETPSSPPPSPQPGSARLDELERRVAREMALEEAAANGDGPGHGHVCRMLWCSNSSTRQIRADQICRLLLCLCLGRICLGRSQIPRLASEIRPDPPNAALPQPYPLYSRFLRAPLHARDNS